jgi:CheY-like chemotaxis protein/two-component sensor histidine kinase
MIVAGKMSFRPEVVDVRALLREVTAILQRTAATREVTLSTRVDDSIGNLVIDPGRLKQILYNFISNALKFTAPGGAIEVRIRDDGPEHFMIEVEDSGIGIAASDLPRLFVEFQQLDAGTAKKHAGTGLGLALTRRLVEAQGGQVGVTSSPGTGSTFHASLPRRAAARRTSAPVFEPTDQARSSVLVVDDADDGRTAIVTALREAGYVVHTAASAAEAIARCKQHRYDAITLDLLLPDASGLDMLRSVREGPNRDTKVLVVTMVSEPEATAGFPVDGVLRKPVEPRALLAALRRLRVAPRRRGRVWIIDDDDGSLELMSATLQGLGLEGLCLASATAALDHLGRELPTAVVLDLLMPELDGFEFLGRFRDIEECRDIPVIVWTAKDLSEDEHERLRSIAQGVVAKGSGTGSRISQFFRELQHG